MRDHFRKPTREEKENEHIDGIFQFYFPNEDFPEEFQTSAKRLLKSIANHGGHIGRVHAAQTGSLYIEITLPGELARQIFGTDRAESIIDDSDEDIAFIKIRFSDHGSAYCSEDLSFAVRPGIDDSDLDEWIAKVESV